MPHGNPVGRVRGPAAAMRRTAERWGRQVLRARPFLVQTKSNRKEFVQRNYGEDAGESSVEENQERGDNPRLKSVPGIGPKTERLLITKGLDTVDKLQELFYEKHNKDKEKMADYLHQDIGIYFRKHALQIATYLDGIAESQDGSLLLPSKKLTFCIEGNISVGKTTFLKRIASQSVELRDMVEIVPEPVGKWQDVGDNHFNILDAFYENPERYAYTFQNYVFVTRLMQEKDSRDTSRELRLLERSVFSDRMVFVRAVHEAHWMSEMELSIYDSWFDPIVSSLPGLVPDAFIYLRAEPEICFNRLQSRARTEENAVTLEYLQGLHEKHEQWLINGSSFQQLKRAMPLHGRPPVVNVDSALKNHPLAIPDIIKDEVCLMNGNTVHSMIGGVPALILDCNQNIDLERDIDAKEEYARKVTAFYKYVQDLHKVTPQKPQLIVNSPMGQVPRLEDMKLDTTAHMLEGLGRSPHLGDLIRRQR